MKKISKKNRFCYYILPVCTAVTLFFTGCAMRQNPSPLPELSEPAAETDSLPADTSNPEADAEKETNTDAAAENISIENDGSRPLSEEELSFFTDYLNDIENNGFVCTFYETPTEMSLDDVLYNAPGASDEPLSDEIRQAYTEEYGEIFTDLTYMTTPEIEAFLSETTGYELQDFQHPLTWSYLPQYDMYLTQHGDVYYTSVTCTEGTRTADGLIEVTYHYPNYLSEDPETNFRYAKVTLQETEPDGSHYLFLKNQSVGGFDPSRISGFRTDADTSAVSGFQSFADFDTITEEKLYGTWYDPSVGETLVLSAEGAYVYIPFLELYGDIPYRFELADRSAKGLCPALYIYAFDNETAPLAYYIAGVTDEYFWCNAQEQIFYRQ